LRYGHYPRRHPHLHLLVTEGGADEAGVFHKIPRIDDARLVDVFTREVLAYLVGRKLLSPQSAERLLSWRRLSTASEACPDIRLAAAGAGRPGPFVACRRRP
jgi:hypothetical protein